MGVILFFMLAAVCSVAPCVTALVDVPISMSVEAAVRDVHARVEDLGLLPGHARRPLVDCVAPSTLSSVSSVLTVSKFSAPTSSDQTEELDGFCDEFFQVNGEYMRFMTDDERSELRIPENEDGNEGFEVASATASLKGVLRLASGEIGEDDNYTFMQLHGEDTSWIRLAHYGRKNVEGDDEDAFNWLWMFIKEGSSSSSDLTSIPMVSLPSDDFEASIVLPGDGTVTISCDSFSQKFDIDWSDSFNYFKAGVYVQDGNPEDFIVEYKSLEYSLD